MLFSLTKADFEGKFEGIMTSGTRDRDGETLDYEAAKKEFLAWSKSQHDATLGRSFGNVRDAHSDNPIGLLTAPLRFDDQNRCIYVKGQLIDPIAKDKLEAGVYGGLSIGGNYKSKDARGNFIPIVGEVSLVDRPANPDSVLTVIKRDCSTTRIKTGSTLPLRKSLAVQRGSADAWGNDLKKQTNSPGLVSRERYASIDKKPTVRKRISPNLRRTLSGR